MTIGPITVRWSKAVKAEHVARVKSIEKALVKSRRAKELTSALIHSQTLQLVEQQAIIDRWGLETAKPPKGAGVSI